ncbi:MAG: chorismate mutase [Kiritimatiellia bacterium]|jgi:chorismate mutase/prephenate dehydratase
MVKSLDELRSEIDRLDDQIVPLLNARAALALEIGRIKKANGEPLHVPSRERDVIDRLTATSKGPMPPESIARIYKEVMAAALALEHKDEGL